jgi:hypothetical protein
MIFFGVRNRIYSRNAGRRILIEQKELQDLLFAAALVIFSQYRCRLVKPGGAP